MAERTTKMITQGLIRRLHSIYRLCGIDDEEKRNIISELTDGRTETTKELTMQEAQYLAGYLQGQRSMAVDEDTRRLKRKRSAALLRMQKAGIDTSDWQRVNAFCEDKRISGKAFWKLSEAELVKLIGKMERIIKKKNHE